MRDRMSYNPRTGMLKWRKTGKPAGWVSERGYVRVSVDKKSYMATHVIWYLQTGEWPKEDTVIDHINRNRSDNRWCNLREVSKSKNNLNSSDRGNATGIRGAYRHKNGGYCSRIKVDGKLTVKYFPTAEAAGAWYARMRTEALET